MLGGWCAGAGVGLLFGSEVESASPRGMEEMTR